MFKMKSAFIASLSTFALLIPMQGAVAEHGHSCNFDRLQSEGEQLFKGFEKKYRPQLKTLQSLADDIEAEKDIDAMVLAASILSLKAIGENFVDELRPEFERLGDGCNSPEAMTYAMKGFLKDQGAPQSALAFIDAFIILKDEFAEDAEIARRERSQKLDSDG